MTQNELNRAVAKATGESLAAIAKMGFIALIPGPYKRGPKTVDWDQAHALRNVSLQRRRKRVPPAV